MKSIIFNEKSQVSKSIMKIDNEFDKSLSKKFDDLKKASQIDGDPKVMSGFQEELDQLKQDRNFNPFSGVEGVKELPAFPDV